MIGANDWRGDPTPQDWMAIYLLCLERAREELRLPAGQAELWANGEADRLLYGPRAPAAYGEPRLPACSAVVGVFHR
jgi:hypothetical protein